MTGTTTASFLHRANRLPLLATDERELDIANNGGPDGIALLDRVGVPVTAPQPATDEAVRRRELIVERTAELFDELGYTDTTMTTIAEAVGLAKPTLYHYFGSKSDILVAIHETFINLLIDSQEARVALGTSPVEQLHGAVVDILKLMETHRGHVRVFFENHRELPPGPRREMRDKRDRYEQMIKDALSEGVEQGVLRAESIPIATMALFGMCNWSYQWWSSKWDGESAEHAADQLFTVIMAGIAA